MGSKRIIQEVQNIFSLFSVQSKRVRQGFHYSLVHKVFIHAKGQEFRDMKYILVQETSWKD